jgi:peptidoglycan/LPS O-acetylase OafA/YrhL
VATAFHVDGAGRGIVLRSWSDIIGASAVWLGFSMLGMPAIDAYMNTPLITAAVTWTMPFEVTFYLLLPLLALPLRVGMTRTALGVGLAAAVWLGAWAPDPRLLAPFLGGMAVALAIRVPRLAHLLRQPAFAPVAAAALASVICIFPTAYAPAALLLQALALAIVAAGNDLFGVLRWRAPRVLGNCAYSLYLLHGIALYTLFLIVMGAERAATLSVLQYIVVIALFTPVVVGLAWASQRWVESPPRRATSFVVAAMRRLLARDARDAEVPDSRASAG